MRTNKKARGLISMAEQEIIRELENHKQQIGSLKHRMDDQEEQTKTMQELVTSVELLATNMGHMLEAQKTQGERLARLEGEPAKTWNNIKRTAITAIVTLLATAVAGGFFLMAAQYLK